MVSRDFAYQLEGYGLTTASILYRMPDHRAILQEFIWQEYDLAPRFPELNRFLAFWTAQLGGPALSRAGCPQGPARASRPARRQRRVQAQLSESNRLLDVMRETKYELCAVSALRCKGPPE